MKINILKRVYKTFSIHKQKISYLPGQTTLQQRSEDVELRGLKINGQYQDLPNLIFFVDMFDQVENWLNFFTHPKLQITEERNVYILYPRNQGNSDYNNEKLHPVQYVEQVGKDVERFMYSNKISTATLGGHGIGGKYALLASSWSSLNTTGYFGIDYSPLNYNYHDFAHTWKHVLQSLSKLDLNKSSRQQIIQSIDEIVQNPKLRTLLQNSLKYSKQQGDHFNFNLNYLNQNLERILDWNASYGLFPGRATFLFPEYTNRIHLGTNTLPMYNICPKIQGFNKDIHQIFCENDTLEENHWIYEDQQLMEGTLKKLLYFLNQQDGIHIQLQNKTEMIENVEIPQQYSQSENASNRTVPEHFHHNWKFNQNQQIII